MFFDSAAQGPLARYSVLAAEPRAALFRDAHGKLDARQGVTPGPADFSTISKRGFAARAAPARSESRCRSSAAGSSIWVTRSRRKSNRTCSCRWPTRRTRRSRCASRTSSFTISPPTRVLCGFGKWRCRSARAAHRGSAAGRSASVRSPCPCRRSPHSRKSPRSCFSRAFGPPRNTSPPGTSTRQTSRGAGGSVCAIARRRRHVYAALRRANPAPFAASVQLNGMSHPVFVARTADAHHGPATFRRGPSPARARARGPQNRIGTIPPSWWRTPRSAPNTSC